MDLSSYVVMLRESLEKKSRVLDAIIEENMRQKDALRDPNCTPEHLQVTMDAKSDYVDELNALDDGFDELFNRVSQALTVNKAAYKGEIQRMQQLIKDITDKAARVRAQEEENNRLATEKFTYIKEQIQKVSKSQQAVNRYYNNMMKVNYFDPQFMDNKK